MLAHITYLFMPLLSINLIDSLASIAFLSYIVYTILIIMISGHKITSDTIYGALCIYFILGIIFGDLYFMIEMVAPGSFGASGHHLVGALVVDRFELIPFSFSTLTPVGHSKVIAISAFAEAVVVIEQLTGVLFLAVLIARLVTGFSVTHRDEI